MSPPSRIIQVEIPAKAKAPNMTAKERKFLVSLMKNHKNIIDSKQSDSHSVVAKNLAWDEITAEFNEFSSYPRSVKQLRTFHKNLKMLDNKRQRSISCMMNKREYSGDYDEETMTQNTYDKEHDCESMSKMEIISDTSQQNQSNVEGDEMFTQVDMKTLLNDRSQDDFNIDSTDVVIAEEHEYLKLRCEKLRSQIEKNRAKTEFYKKKTKLFNLQIAKFKQR